MISSVRTQIEFIRMGHILINQQAPAGRRGLALHYSSNFKTATAALSKQAGGLFVA